MQDRMGLIPIMTSTDLKDTVLGEKPASKVANCMNSICKSFPK